MIKIHKSTKGFTLIELLVVISIIGLLSSVVLASLNQARMKARDTRRVQDLKQIQNALELYRLDYGRYPVIPSCGDWCLSNQGAWQNFEDELNSGTIRISNLPTDPINTGGGLPSQINNYKYAYISGDQYDETGFCANGECYDLVARLEDTSNELRSEIRNYQYNNTRTSLNTYYQSYSPGQLYSPQN